MSVIGSTHSLAREAFARLQNLTPTPPLDDNVRKTSSKAECELLRCQGWGGENKKLVEQTRREKIQDLEYWRCEIKFKVSIFDEQVSSAGLAQLYQIIDQLDKILLGLGMPPEDVENARFEVPGTNLSFWNHELDFRRGLKEETQGWNQSNGEDSQPAQPTCTSSRRRAGNKITADKLRGSAGVRKSTRTGLRKPTITKEYNLRSKYTAAA